jgi:arylsulfatase A-like enzyme
VSRVPLSVVLFAWAACTTSTQQPEAPVTARPNVLFVFYDQYRPDIIGAYGGTRNIETPNLDRLASEGVLFTNALSTTPVCTPYRGMLMTGRYPTHTGIMLNFLEANTKQTNLADVFSDAGYRTAFMGKWHLAAGGFKMAWVGQEDGSWDQARPYMEANPDYDYVPPGARRLGFRDWAAYNFQTNYPAEPYYGNESTKLVMDGYESDALTGMAIEYMDRARSAGDPFFLVVAPHPPHPPFDLLPDGYLERVPEKLEWDSNVPEEMKSGKDLAEARAYYAMAKNADDNMGRLLAFLDASGLARSTIVVFTSDHGEMLGSHGRRDKMVPYDEAVQVPLLVRWPGRVSAGARTDTLQTPLDHMPTLIAMAGLEAPEGLDGVDLSPELLGGKSKTIDREAVLMANYTANWDYFKTAGERGANWPEWRAVKTKQYTYARWIDGRIELYDDVADPDQMTDLSREPAFAKRVSELETTLRQLLARAHDEYLPGNAYVAWVDRERNIIRTGLGPVQP